MNRKFGKRLFSGLLALCVAAMIPLSVSAQTVAEIQAEQDRLQAEKDQLEAQLEQLRNDEAEKQAEQENLQEQIDVRHIDVTRPGVCPGLSTDIDVIVASEILYLDDLHKPLLNFLERHLARDGQAVFCTDMARRKPHFAKTAAKRFRVSELYLPGSFTNDEGEAQKRLYSLLILQRQA